MYIQYSDMHMHIHILTCTNVKNVLYVNVLFKTHCVCMCILAILRLFPAWRKKLFFRRTYMYVVALSDVYMYTPPQYAGGMCWLHGVEYVLWCLTPTNQTHSLWPVTTSLRSARATSSPSLEVRNSCSLSL